MGQGAKPLVGFGAKPQGLSSLQGQVPFRRNGITCYTILTMNVFRDKIRVYFSTKKSVKMSVKGVLVWLML